LVGSGGILSHAPRRAQAALMLVDGFLPEGVTKLAVDSIFMMPQLGVLSTVHERAATEVFDKDCLVRLGTCIAPAGLGKEAASCLRVTIGDTEKEVRFGEMALIPLGVGEKEKALIEPARGFDVGEGKGKKLEAEVEGGVVGVIIDGRGRPLSLPGAPEKRTENLNEWNRALGIYPVSAG